MTRHMLCGCVIECSAREHEPRITFCPLHAQAEGMRTLIRRNLAQIEEACAESGYRPGVDEALWIEDARALLRAIEGRETP